MSKIIKVAAIMEENTRYAGRTGNPLGKQPTTSPDKTPCGTHTATTLTPGRMYKFTTTISSLMNWGAALVNNEGIITREFQPAVTNQPHNYTVIPVEGEVKLYINNRDYGEVEITYDAEEANYMPGQYKNTSFRPFRFWCQTVLPLVYDDSLSYYELLSKVVSYLNATIGDLNKLTEEYSDIRNAYKELEAFVNNYFENLDVSAEINAKLDQMAEDGDFDEMVEAVLETLDYEGIIGREVGEQLPTVVGEQIGSVVGEQIDGVVAEQIDDVVGEQISGVVAEQIDDVVGEQIGGVVHEQIGTEVARQIGDEVDEKIEAPVNKWLDTNFTEPPIDNTLSMENGVPSAKLVGDEIRFFHDEQIEYYRREEISISTIDTTNPGYLNYRGGSYQTVEIVPRNENPNSVKYIYGLLPGATYRMTMTYTSNSSLPADMNVIAVNEYNSTTKTAKVIGNVYNGIMNGGETYDFEFTLPYNARGVICEVVPNTSFVIWLKSSRFVKDYDISIENYEQKKHIKVESNTSANSYISKNNPNVVYTYPNCNCAIYGVNGGDKLTIETKSSGNSDIIPAIFYFGNSTSGWRGVFAATDGDADGVGNISKEVTVPKGVTRLAVNTLNGTPKVYEADPFTFVANPLTDFAKNLYIDGYYPQSEIPTGTANTDKAYTATGSLVNEVGCTAYSYRVQPGETYRITTGDSGYPVATLWNGEDRVDVINYNDTEYGYINLTIPNECNKMYVNAYGNDFEIEKVDVTFFLTDNALIPAMSVDEHGVGTSWIPVATFTGGGADPRDISYDWRKAIPEPPIDADDEYTLKARVTSGSVTYFWDNA
mgnify:CR=1 FL=1